MTESDLPVVRMAHGRWGDPDRKTVLPAMALEALRHLGARPAPPAVPVPDLATPASTHVAALAAVVGADQVKTDNETRWRHTRGYSTPDLLRDRAGDTADAPDLVVLPGSHDEVQALLAACAELGLAVVPFAGGTSVVGGLAPQREGYDAVVAVDLARLDEVDRKSVV